jgi:glycosyltransferase involved in cell wall biosynthesis
MTVSPLVTILVATFNRADLLAITLQSILLQDFQDYEVWVIGDGCTDHSAAVVAAIGDARFQWYNLPQNHKSPYAAYNEGFRRAKGQYVAYLEHDDLWLPNHLSTMLAALENQQVDVMRSMIVYYKSEDVVECKGRIFDRFVWFPANPSVSIHHRKVIDKGILWANPYEVGQGADSYFFQSLYDANLSFGFLKDITVVLFPSYNHNIYKAKSFIQKEFLNKLYLPNWIEAVKLPLLLNIADYMNTVMYQKQQQSLKILLKHRISQKINVWVNKYSLKYNWLKKIKLWLHLRQRRRAFVKRGLQ